LEECFEEWKLVNIIHRITRSFVLKIVYVYGPLSDKFFMQGPLQV